MQCVIKEAPEDNFFQTYSNFLGTLQLKQQRDVASSQGSFHQCFTELCTTVVFHGFPALAKHCIFWIKKDFDVYLSVSRKKLASMGQMAGKLCSCCHQLSFTEGSSQPGLPCTGNLYTCFCQRAILYCMNVKRDLGDIHMYLVQHSVWGLSLSFAQ